MRRKGELVEVENDKTAWRNWRMIFWSNAATRAAASDL